MAPSIGVNLRVTGHCSQGGRKHMEDMFSVAYQQTEDDKDLEYAFFGIFDGHGGREAAMFAKDHLMDFIVNQKAFWSDSDEEILRAIKEGFIQTHYAMWGELEMWPRTASGLPSTAGTTASIAFVRKGKIYIGHVGDSQIILGYQNEGQDGWEGIPLTREHKPESDEEITRIERSGGKVVSKQGVPRVVWNRPRIGHKGPVRRSTHIDEIPFLAVARSLGDLWSYNSELDEFVVSPEPDVEVVDIKVGVHKCLIFGTDGLWNMMTPNLAAQIVKNAEYHNEKHVLEAAPTNQWINPSKSLVDRALGQWSMTNMRADNTSAVTLMLDPPGPPRAEVLRKKTSTGSDCTQSTFHDPKGCVAVFTRHTVVCNTEKSDLAVSTSTTHVNPEEKLMSFVRNMDEPRLPPSGPRLPPSAPQIPPSSSRLPLPSPRLPLSSPRLPPSSPRFHSSGSQIPSSSPRSNSDVKLQFNEVSSSIEEAGPVSVMSKVDRIEGVAVTATIDAGIINSLAENDKSMKVMFEVKMKHQAPLPCVGRSKVLQSTNMKNHVEASESRPSFADVKRLREVSSPSDSRFFRRRPEKDDDTSDAENYLVSWGESNPDVENINYDKSSVNPDKLVSSTIPNRSLLKREHSTEPNRVSNKRRLRSDTLADSPVRTLRSRNVDILLQTSKIKSKKIHSILPRAPKVKRLHSVSSRPITAKRRRPMVLRSRLRKRLSK